LAEQRVVAVSAGHDHSIAITASGAVWSWGLGANGMLGHGDQQSRLLPKKVEAFAAQHHSLALTADGALWSWGGGDYGKLGHGDEQGQNTTGAAYATPARTARHFALCTRPPLPQASSFT